MKNLRPLLVALLVIGGLAACGKEGEKPASSGEPAPPTTVEETTTTAPETDEAGEATEIAVTGKEYAYDADVEGITAGPISVTLDNEGEEEHQVSIVRLKPGKTQADFAALGADVSQFDEVLETFGGPNAVAPGESNSSLQVLEPGDYFFACFIPAPDGQPHAAKGMVLPLTVGEAEGEVAELPEEEQSLALQDYAFGFGDDALLEAGAYTVSNKGPQAHEVAIYAPAEGSDAQDVVDYFGNPTPSGPPPATSAGGIGPIDPGRTVNIELEAGEYVFVCFIPDAADGAPHFTKGMIQVVTVE
ncbi:MAG TPA: hypothetical protein VFU93_04180 [Acidimicrobiales bacterium]|nr:hypothetical protein [Acidimicrobiales bacterium]